MLRSRRESHHSDRITEQHSLQPTSATKSAISDIPRRNIFVYMCGKLPTGRAEIPIIAMGSNGAFTIQLLSVAARTTRRHGGHHHETSP
jgi:hypothetical protein